MKKISRRNMVKGTAAAAVAWNFQVVPSRVFGANSKLTLGAIGTGGKGVADIKGCDEAGFEVVSLCDVVDVAQYPNVEGRLKNLVGTRAKYPDASFYMDWREMIAGEGDKIDAVTISAPDHVHAHPAIAAMRAGKHVYCQKPLSHSVWEARAMAKVAAETGVVTQMGNQAHANDHMRRCVELIQAGIIGDVRQVHAWTNRPIWPQGIPKYPEAEPVPKHIDWDLWLGPAQGVEFSTKILPFNWRGYWEFGTGALGDMACHIMDMSYWAADLGAPTSVEAISADGRGAQSDISPPTWSTITYKFMDRGDKPAVKYVWYDGYKDAVFNPDKWALESSIDPSQRPQERNLPPDSILSGQGPNDGNNYGCVIIGEDNARLYFDRGKDTWIVKPGSRLDGFKAEQTIPRARDQDPYKEFYDAIVAGDPKGALSNMHHSGPFTEMVLLGNLAVRLDKEVKWNAAKLKSPNCPEADQFIRRSYRKGWELDVEV
ncbi:MAG: hypothetical protein CMO47_01150 [Verrucomicrobiales bacterium]|nr:hypothetical protein [Verrucomicrobiales bacterium]|tara:strand:- start:1489 stop:2946 length:1458 start_codon:yes stop_codon:yes gene_type:complete